MSDVYHLNNIKNNDVKPKVVSNYTTTCLNIRSDLEYCMFLSRVFSFWRQNFRMGHVLFFFHTPAVVQQEAKQAEQDEGHASQYGQQEHGVVRVDVLRKHWTCRTDKKWGKERKSVSRFLDELQPYSTHVKTSGGGFTVNKLISHLSVVGTWLPTSIPTVERCRSD